MDTIQEVDLAGQVDQDSEDQEGLDSVDLGDMDKDMGALEGTQEEGMALFLEVMAIRVVSVEVTEIPTEVMEVATDSDHKKVTPQMEFSSDQEDQLA